jgi:hypothetical protein
MAVINLRTDTEVDQALALLGAGPDSRNRSKIIRQAILDAAKEVRRARLRAEALEVASDPDDLAEVRATQEVMESLRAW